MKLSFSREWKTNLFYRIFNYRQFNNRIPCFTPRCRGRLFYIGYFKFYIFRATNSRIDYRGVVEKIEFAQRFMKKMLRLLGANRHILIPYFYFLIIYFFRH